MIKSMTGYGYSRIKYKNYSFFIEMRSVNSRYLDIILKMPERISDMEDKVKKILKDTIKRGHINFTIKDEGEETEEFEVDMVKIKNYSQALKDIKNKFKIAGELNLDLITRLPQVFKLKEKNNIIIKLWPVLQNGIEQVIDLLNKSRLNEGKNIYQDFIKRLASISTALKRIEEKAPLAVKAQKEKLERNLKEFLPDLNLNHPRVVEELTLFASRVDISEEISRLKSHLEYFRKTLESETSIGKKLDFIVQEMNRETNTLSSKADSFLVSSQAIIIKEEIEKMREQVQNVE